MCVFKVRGTTVITGVRSRKLFHNPSRGLERLPVGLVRVVATVPKRFLHIWPRICMVRDMWVLHWDITLPSTVQDPLQKRSE